MRTTDATVYAGELCLYLAAGGFLLWPAGDRGGMALFLVLALAAECACAMLDKRQGPIRYLPALLLVPLFLTARTVQAAIRPVPALMLILLRCRKHRWRMEYYSVKNLFAVGGAVCGAVAVTFVLTGYLERLAADSFPFCVMWLLLSVFNLRLLRNPYVSRLDGRFKSLNLALLGCVALTGAALSSPLVVSAVTDLLLLLWNGLAVPALTLLLYAVVVVFQVLNYAFNYLFWLIGRGQQTVEPPQINFAPADTVLENNLPPDAEPSQWLIRIAIAAGVLVFLAAAWLIVRALLSPARPEADEPGAIQRESLPSARRSLRSGRAAAEGVREVYRKYLALCASLDIPVDGTEDSDAIRAASAPYTGGEDAAALREQWLPVRYGGRESTSAGVKQARQSLRRMREAVSAAKRAEARRQKGR